MDTVVNLLCRMFGHKHSWKTKDGWGHSYACLRCGYTEDDPWT